jgi:hypothetical protein
VPRNASIETTSRGPKPTPLESRSGSESMTPANLELA